jgi:hypothetical protein
MASPSGIFTLPSAKAIYVTDGGNRRIVAFSKEDGKFLRQYPLNDLPAIHSLWVDEAAGRLYLATDSQVFLAIATP